jgi:hypothetical protein
MNDGGRATQSVLRLRASCAKAEADLVRVTKHLNFIYAAERPLGEYYLSMRCAHRAFMEEFASGIDTPSLLRTQTTGRILINRYDTYCPNMAIGKFHLRELETKCASVEAAATRAIHASLLAPNGRCAETTAIAKKAQACADTAKEHLIDATQCMSFILRYMHVSEQMKADVADSLSIINRIITVRRKTIALDKQYARREALAAHQEATRERTRAAALRTARNAASEL